MQMFIHTIKLLLILFMFSCSTEKSNSESSFDEGVKVGAERMDLYLNNLKDRKVALCINHTSKVGEVSLYDTLRQLGIEIPIVFTPEHGFKGTADAGETVNNDSIGETRIVSLYGKQKKPSAEHLENIDIVIFDIQDAGARFYTYISTMHYIMEACAENDKPLLILDRPNPNGHYVDGPVLDMQYQSFVGMHPIPIVHGMTVGELATMINAEGWLSSKSKAQIDIVKTQGWTHEMPYILPNKPSPNLPNERSVNLYPSLCLFEGTVVSIGRGTKMPFQVVGHPDFPEADFSFTPVSMEGAKYPKFENQECFGIDLRQSEELKEIDLDLLIDFYKIIGDSTDSFFNNYFVFLAGTNSLQKQIKEGWSAEQIRNSWQADSDEFKRKREKYLLYP